MKGKNLIFAANIFFCTLAMLTFGSCSDDDSVTERSWELVWEDEFEGPAGQLPDDNSWKFDVGTGWGNNQLEFDTDRAENVSYDGEGNLAIIARNENFAGASYTSGRITTQDRFTQTYGRFEARIKLPWGQGLWPAFWLLGADIPEVGWPQCGEIDIMEYRGQEPNIVHGSLHGPGYSAGEALTRSYTLPDGRFDSNFHIFRVDWGADYIDYYVDDVLYYQIKPSDPDGEWVYDHPFFIILNLAVGGNYVGPPSTATVFPQTMLVDWVRVYKEVE